MPNLLLDNPHTIIDKLCNIFVFDRAWLQTTLLGHRMKTLCRGLKIYYDCAGRARFQTLYPFQVGAQHPIIVFPVKILLFLQDKRRGVMFLVFIQKWDSLLEVISGPSSKMGYLFNLGQSLTF